jgi:hypothetical protein
MFKGSFIMSNPIEIEYYGDLVLNKGTNIYEGNLIVHGNLIVYGKSSVRVNGDLYVKGTLECIDCNVMIKNNLYCKCLYTECEMQVNGDIRALSVYAAHNKNRMHVNGDLEALLLVKDEFWRVSVDGTIKSYINIECVDELIENKDIYKIIKKEYILDKDNRPNMYLFVRNLLEKKDVFNEELVKLYNL